jgi:uncharacterized protein YjiS (DUF1127 family)
MNHLSSPHVGPLSRSPIDHVFAALGDRLYAAKGSLLSRWSDYQAHRREARALVAVDEMDPHLLRDIGAPDEVIARAVESRRASPWREGPLRLTMVLATIAVIGAVAPPSAAEAAGTKGAAKADARNEMVGTFTGELVDGAPVYRFPTVIVAGSRGAEPAGCEARMAQHRAPKGTPAKRPV